MENLSGQARIGIISRGLFFEHKADIGEKDSFRSGIIEWPAALTDDQPRQG